MALWLVVGRALPLSPDDEQLSLRLKRLGEVQTISDAEFAVHLKSSR